MNVKYGDFHLPDMTNVTLLFEGEDDHLLPSTSESIIDIDLFIVAGRIIGHSFLHGGPPLYGLSEAVVQMVVQGTADMSSMTVRDVADFDLRGTIKMVKSSSAFLLLHYHEVVCQQWNQYTVCVFETNFVLMFQCNVLSWMERLN